jgi:hypothetical protein
MNMAELQNDCAMLLMQGVFANSRFQVKAALQPGQIIKKFDQYQIEI